MCKVRNVKVFYVIFLPTKSLKKNYDFTFIIS